MASTSNPNLVGDHEIQSENIQVPGKGAEIKAYVARPAGVTAAPGIVVIHENKGLVPYVRDVADGLASAGYIALAPDLLSREGGTESFNDPNTDIPPKLAEIPRERHLTDVQSVIDWLRAQSNVTQLGIIGFCFGGGITWRMATTCPDLAVAVPFYGAIPPVEEVPQINAAVFAVYGETDERINSGIGPITEAMKSAGKTFQSKVYPQAGHAFHNHTNPPERYNAEAAKSAWADALAWLGKHLRQ